MRDDFIWNWYLEGSSTLEEPLLGNHEGVFLEVIGFFPFEDIAAAFSTTGSAIASESQELDSIDITASKGSSIGGGGTTFELYTRKGNGASIWGDDGSATSSCLFDGLDDDPCLAIFLIAMAFLFAIWEI